MAAGVLLRRVSGFGERRKIYLQDLLQSEVPAVRGSTRNPGLMWTPSVTTADTPLKGFNQVRKPTISLTSASWASVFLGLLAFFYWPLIIPAFVALLLAERLHRSGHESRRTLWAARLFLLVVSAPLVLASLLIAKVGVYDIYYQRQRLRDEIRARDAVREVRTGLGRFAELRGYFPGTLQDLVELGLIDRRYSSKCVFGYTEACFFGYMMSYDPDAMFDKTEGYSRFTLIAYPGYLTFGSKNFMLVHTGEILARDSLEDVNGSLDPPPPGWRVSAAGIPQARPSVLEARPF